MTAEQLERRGSKRTSQRKREESGVAEVEQAHAKPPRKPSFLTPRAFDLFDELVATIPGLIEADSLQVAACAQAILDWQDAHTIVSNEGETVESSRGGPATHPAVRHRADAHRRMTAALKALGATPTSRRAPPPAATTTTTNSDPALAIFNPD